jgi:hypothetical protein
MAQIIFYGNINHYAYACVQDELHRTIRYRQVFVQDNHLTAIANDSPTSPEGTINNMLYFNLFEILYTYPCLTQSIVVVIITFYLYLSPTQT